MKNIDELILEYTETHNHIVRSLNEAEKSHAETLAVFISELEKRKDKIVGVNSGIEQFNELIKTMAIRLESTNQRINALNILSGNIEFSMKHLQENVVSALRDLGKDSFKDFFRKAWVLLCLNVVLLFIIAGLILYKK